MFEVTSAWSPLFPKPRGVLEMRDVVNPVHHPELEPFDLLLENIPQLKVREGYI